MDIEQLKPIFEKIEQKQREHSEAILAIEQKGGIERSAPTAAHKGLSPYLEKSAELGNLLERKTRQAGVKIEAKDLLPGLAVKNTVTSSAATNPEQQVPIIVHGPEQRVFLRQLLPSLTATGASYVFTREASYTNSAAAQTAEGAAKAESALTYEEKTGSIATYAHWLRVSKQVAEDRALLTMSIENRLRYGVEFKIEDALLNGTGADGQLGGLLTTGNHTDFVPTASDTAVDSVRKAIQALETAYYTPGLVIMNPADVAAAELLKDAEERYIVGRPVAGGLRSLWGIPLYSTPHIAAGTFVAMDPSSCMVFMRQDAVVEFSDSDEDNFTKNLLTVRAEARMGFAVALPAGVRVGSLVAA